MRTAIVVVSPVGARSSGVGPYVNVRLYSHDAFGVSAGTSLSLDQAAELARQLGVAIERARALPLDQVGSPMQPLAGAPSAITLAGGAE